MLFIFDNLKIAFNGLLSDNVNWDLLGTLNSTIVNVALPVMPQEMKVSINAIQWVISVYPLMTVLLLLIFGKSFEFIGKKYILSFGTLVFAIGSLLYASFT